MSRDVQKSGSRNLPVDNRPASGALTYVGEVGGHKSNSGAPRSKRKWILGLVLLTAIAAAFSYWQLISPSGPVLSVDEVKDVLRHPDAIASQVLIRDGKGMVDVRGVISSTTVDEVPVLTLRSPEGSYLDLEVTETPLEDLAGIKETDTVTARCKIADGHREKLQECEMLAVEKL